MVPSSTGSSKNGSWKPSSSSSSNFSRLSTPHGTSTLIIISYLPIT